MDCDVIQADGGTRTTAITGSFIALADALIKLKKDTIFNKIPIIDHVAAISVGILGGKPMLDLTYEEDSRAEVDMNVIMTGEGKFIEVQGTAEGEPFSGNDMDKLITLAKTQGTPLFLIGHVTKEGFIAGPKVLEHMVDTLLYFEGDKNYFYRILRAVKNRFGSTNEIGIFEMTTQGLMEVPNPSEMFLSQRKDDISGSAVISAMEGARALLLEIQALVSRSNYG